MVVLQHRTLGMPKSKAATVCQYQQTAAAHSLFRHEREGSMARPEGFEPPTSGSGGQRSIH